MRFVLQNKCPLASAEPSSLTRTREKPMIDRPLAYFLTWTTYGTWLPGDDRGWVRWHEGNRDPSKLLHDFSASAMVESEVALDPAARQLVDATIRSHCDIRSWSLHALNVRTNHVHVVLSTKSHSPDDVVKQLKAWTTRRLKEQQALAEPDIKPRERWWTEGSSRRMIFSEDDLATVVQYVIEAQAGPRDR